MSRKKLKNYYLGNDYPGVYFTQREMDCLVHLIEGHTVSSAAAILELSPRTVEFYVKNMRMKMGLPTKSALVKKIREMDFVNRQTIKPAVCKPEILKNDLA